MSDRKLRVGVVFGGRSSEHEVSLMSARSVLDALDLAKYEVIPIGVTKDGRWLVASDAVEQLIERAEATGALEGEVAGTTAVALLPEPESGGALIPTGGGEAIDLGGKLDVVFPLIHGRTGEDGVIQGLLELTGAAYVGAGVLGSAIGMDKAVCKALWERAGLPVTPYRVVRTHRWHSDPGSEKGEIASSIGFPCFVKPANSGSSIGVHKVASMEALEPAVEDAARYDTKLVVEAAITGRELEVSVLGNEAPEASVVGEIVPGHEFYDYEDKYFDDVVELIVPAELPEATADRVRAIAVDAFVVAEASGMGRVDFFLESETDALYLNEINTIPGFTRMSMYPRLWEASQVPFPALCDRLIELALERRRERRSLRQTR